MTEKIGFRGIPMVAKVLAALVIVAAIFLPWLCFRLGLAELSILAAAGPSMAGFVLLVGYVYVDAKRRGMPAGVWAALVLLVPNLIGFVLYFVLRKPIMHSCTQCGGGVPEGAGFCSRCGQAQAQTA